MKAFLFQALNVLGWTINMTSPTALPNPHQIFYPTGRLSQIAYKKRCTTKCRLVYLQTEQTQLPGEETQSDLMEMYVKLDF